MKVSCARNSLHFFPDGVPVSAAGTSREDERRLGIYITFLGCTAPCCIQAREDFTTMLIFMRFALQPLQPPKPGSTLRALRSWDILLNVARDGQRRCVEIWDSKSSLGCCNQLSLVVQSQDSSASHKTQCSTGPVLFADRAPALASRFGDTGYGDQNGNPRPRADVCTLQDPRRRRGRQRQRRECSARPSGGLTDPSAGLGEGGATSEAGKAERLNQGGSATGQKFQRSLICRKAANFGAGVALWSGT